MEHNEFHDLLAKYLDGNCNEAEKEFVECWYWQYHEEQNADLTDEEIETAQLEVFQKLPQPIVEPMVIKKYKPGFPMFRLVAAVAILLLLFGYFFMPIEKPVVVENQISDIEPGGHKAMLLLASGVSYDLEKIEKGEIVVNEGVKIIKTADGELQLTYIQEHLTTGKTFPRDTLKGLVGSLFKKKESISLNTVSTPMGGQFKIALPDGTRVWLNAGSVLKFPSSLGTPPERRVYLTGEAYFQVPSIVSLLGMQKRASRVPFIVQTGNQEVRVMGTEFNINSYDNAPNSIVTTLFKGLVKISNPTESQTIKPGIMASNNGSQISVRAADLEKTAAWKNGEFMFSQENLGNIMIRIARWYDVEVIYDDLQIQSMPFSGTISKYSKISELMHLLEVTGEIRYRIEGKKLYISKRIGV